ncbi:MAG: SDR family NAD(P)-dependent oxidoreductase [Bacteroidetes bacterium]|nr:SDR family NAD(P)-dependent oxidoreductase [Bacteroidota bacterium]
MSADSRMKSMPRWKHVVVTGAAQGLGRALTEICADAGITVSMIDHNEPLLTEARETLTARGSVAPYCCDVSDNTQLGDVFQRIRETDGVPDAVICCAAIGDSAWKQRFEAAVLERVLRVNLLGIANCLEHCLPGMCAEGGGTFVMVSSLLDARGYPGTASYSVSKAALRAMADSARILLRASGIRVVLVRPGFMRTALTTQNTIRMPGMLSADDAARRILRDIARGKEVIAFPRWLAVFAEAARLFPRPLYERMTRAAMIRDGEAEDLHYRPRPAEGG